MIDDDKPKLEVAVGTSIKQDARQAGREVAENTLKQMKSKPNFFLLFSTINYDDYGGFQDFLNGVWEVLPEGTPLVGGTVFGFLNSQGCYAKGATAMAVSYPNMNVTVGYGKNTKRSPKKAARRCAKMLKNGLKNKYNNKFLFSMISGFTLPKVPKKSQEVAFVKSVILARMAVPVLNFYQKVFQRGFGNEEYILEKLTKELPEFELIHGSSIDDMKTTRKYEFYNKTVFTNSIVCLGLETDIDFDLNFTTGVTSFEGNNIELEKIELSKDKRLIKKINDKPAYPEFLRLMNWTEESLEIKAIDRIIRFPIAYYKNDKILVRVILLVLGTSLGFIHKFEGKNGFVVQMTQQKLVGSIDELLTLNKPEFGFFVSCCFYQMFLGYNVYEVQEKLKKYFQDKPFLFISAGGEGTYIPNEGIYFLNETTVSAIFGEKQ